MLYTFLISIVFIAELIIAFTLINILFKFDKSLVMLNDKVTETAPKLKEIGELSNKISEQWIELADEWVEEFKIKEENAVFGQLNKLLIAILFIKINSKTIRRFRRSKLGKILKRGFAFVQSMV